MRAASFGENQRASGDEMAENAVSGKDYRARGSRPIPGARSRGTRRSDIARLDDRVVVLARGARTGPGSPEEPVAIIKQTGPGEARKAVSAILAFGYRHMAGIECRQVVVPPPWAPSDWIGGRHQIGTVRGIRSVYPGGFVGIRRLRASLRQTVGQDDAVAATAPGDRPSPHRSRDLLRVVCARESPKHIS